MLGKLIKYEFKACGRTFLPIYIGIIIISILNGLFSNYNLIPTLEDGIPLDTSVVGMQNVLILVLFALFVALFVITITLIIQRFNKNLLQDEGYLMFTLPVTTKNLILSKYLVAIIFVIFSGIVAITSFIIIALCSGQISHINLFNVFNEMDLSTVDVFIIFIDLFIRFIISYSIFILTIYLSISVGQFSKLNKHKVPAGIISFFIISTIVTKLQSFMGEIILPESAYTQITENLNVEYFGYDMILFVLNIIIAVVIFMGIYWILDKKLNLE